MLAAAIANPTTNFESVPDLVAQASASFAELSIQPGSRGPQVVDLQTRLKDLGYYSGNADGIYGDATQAAVAQFQRETGLPATGIVNQQTWQRLQGGQAEAEISESTPASSPDEDSGSDDVSSADSQITSQDDAVEAETEISTDRPSDADAPASVAPEVSETPSETSNSSDRSNTSSNLAWLRRILLVMVVAIVAGGLYRFGRWAGQREFRHGAFAKGRSPQLEPADAGSFDTNEMPSGHTAEDVASSEDDIRTAVAANGLGGGDRPQSALNSSDAFNPSDASNASDSSALVSEHVHTSASLLDNSDAQSFSVEPTTRLAKVNIVDELIKDLQNPDPGKRRKAIWELGQRGNSDAIQPLSDLLIDADSNQRSLILAAMSEIGVRSLKPLSRALILSLQDESSDVRRNAIRDVTRVYDLMAQVGQVLHHAAHDDDEEVQETARWAIGQLDRIRGVADIDRLLNSESSKHASESLPESSDT